jgi:probable HAF family extracellular repeat protein
MSVLAGSVSLGYNFDMRIAGCLGGLLLAAACFAQPQYEVVDLTKQYGEDFTALAINNHGTIAGSMFIDFQTTQACLVQNGKLEMLPMYQGKHDWYPVAINDAGDVLGWGELNGTTHSFLYRNGKVLDILAGDPAPRAFAMNNLTQVTGYIGTTPFIWENGVFTTIPGNGAAFGINDSQTLVGRTAGHEARMWRAGKYIDVHPPWASDSEAMSINSLDEAVGTADLVSGGRRGVLWRGEEVIQLPTLGGGQSQAYDINDSSQIVGLATNSTGNFLGFLWEKGSMYELEELIPGGSGFVILQFAHDINNVGQILTSGFTGKANHELLLNPVPEPTTLLTMFIGLVLLTILCRKSGADK